MRFPIIGAKKVAAPMLAPPFVEIEIGKEIAKVVVGWASKGEVTDIVIRGK